MLLIEKPALIKNRRTTRAAGPPIGRDIVCPANYIGQLPVRVKHYFRFSQSARQFTISTACMIRIVSSK